MAKSNKQQLKEYGLNDKQIVFFLELLAGSDAQAAYMKAYPKSKRSSANASAIRLKSKLLANASLKAWLQKSGKPSEKSVENKVLSIEERKEWLTNLITAPVVNKENGVVYPADKLKALDILNKMDSAYVQKSEVSGDIKLQMGWGDDPDGDSDNDS